MIVAGRKGIMRRIAISVLSVFVVFPALADARLPVVNLSAGGVSARAAFGEPIVQSVKTSAASNQSASIATSQSSPERNLSAASVNTAQPKSVASRNTVAPSNPQPRSASVDTGEQIIASADVLTPRRPSADLWARVDTPLRLPDPSEFSVIRSDAALPEESLDTEIVRMASNAPVYPIQNAQPVEAINTVAAPSEPLSELDAQIARLNELQRRADASVSDASSRAPTPARNVVARSVVARPVVSGKSVAAQPTQKIAQNNARDESHDINLSRMVVPMDDDVVVRAVEKSESPRIVSVRNDMTSMSPSELRKAFRKTFLSENKHLSTFQIDDRFDVASDMTANAAGFTSARDLSETGDIRPLEIKIKFRNDDSALSRDNYTLLTEYAGIVLSNPTRAVQVSIPASVTTDSDDRKLAARRLAIVEQVLRDNGISEQRILPVLSQRDEEGLVLRMISLDQYETLTKQQRDIFGDTVNKKTYRSMSW